MLTSEYIAPGQFKMKDFAKSIEEICKIRGNHKVYFRDKNGVDHPISTINWRKDDATGEEFYTLENDIPEDTSGVITTYTTEE